MAAGKKRAFVMLTLARSRKRFQVYVGYLLIRRRRYDVGGLCDLSTATSDIGIT